MKTFKNAFHSTGMRGQTSFKPIATHMILSATKSTDEVCYILQRSQCCAHDVASSTKSTAVRCSSFHKANATHVMK